MGGIHRNLFFSLTVGGCGDEFRLEMVSRPVSCSSPSLCLMVTTRLPAPLIPHPHSSPGWEDSSPLCCQSHWSEQDRMAQAEPVVLAAAGNQTAHH